jgi:LacI family transcriptional regulator, galactose operon repressor
MSVLCGQWNRNLSNSRNRFQLPDAVPAIPRLPRLIAVTADRPSRRAPRIDDVAERAGVSKATVSRVLNGSRSVAPDKEARVRRAAQELGYEPFGPAQALRQQRVRVWAVIIADIENPFFTSMVRGIEDVAYGEGYRLVLCNSDGDVNKEAGYLDIAIRERMAGVVIAAASNTDSHIERLVAEGIPAVAVDRRLDGPRVDSVVVDNATGAAEATRHLIEGGSRRVACIAGPPIVSTSNERLSGYRDGLRSAGVSYDRALVRRADYREDGGYKAARSLLALDDRPDALFVTNNLMTVGALRAIRDADLRIPRDIAVVGFDDSPLAELMHPRLTVVAQPTYEIGRTAAELLADRAAPRSPKDIVLMPRLVVRESSQWRRSRRS